MSPEAAARLCTEQANRASGPYGAVSVGVGSGGRASTDFVIGITSDALAGRDPQAVYDDCMRARSGQGPIRPYIP
ncbi:hypothetical protein E2L08_04465 [Palleronia sediminis]|uniref:Uncharacterized protein n=2 Tax=Palleronia sediminis TaxID=2547833 RepID=A0A4R6ADT2_9RHOB|nr:hypothetical protein E2L08_04465 [Palleronia sediminis]